MKVGGSLTGLTVSRKVSSANSPPGSVTLTVIVAAPFSLAAGVIGSVRLAPLPPGTRLALGTSDLIVRGGRHHQAGGAESRSPTVKLTVSGVSSLVVWSRMSEIVGGAGVGVGVLVDVGVLVEVAVLVAVAVGVAVGGISVASPWASACRWPSASPVASAVDVCVAVGVTVAVGVAVAVGVGVTARVGGRRGRRAWRRGVDVGVAVSRWAWRAVGDSPGQVAAVAWASPSAYWSGGW